MATARPTADAATADAATANVATADAATADAATADAAAAAAAVGVPATADELGASGAAGLVGAPHAAAAGADDDARVLGSVNAELRRARRGGWRRLLPSAKSAEYADFFSAERHRNSLPFDL